MSDFDALIKIIKKAAVDAVNAANPADFSFGTVISETPLKIKVDQKLILTNKQLYLTRNVIKHKLTINENEVTIDNRLKVDDKVILARCNGGQRYIVIDKVVDVI